MFSYRYTKQHRLYQEPETNVCSYVWVEWAVSIAIIFFQTRYYSVRNKQK